MEGQVERTLAAHLGTVSQGFPVLLVTGARQVGKTTMLRMAAEEGRAYVSLDEPLARQQAIDDPPLLLSRFHGPVLIDEIQYAPQLLPWIKLAVDAGATTGNPEYGRFWLTGSQQFHLMKGVSESLAGRVAVLDLLGLSRLESLGLGDRVRPFLPPGTCPPGDGNGIDSSALYRTIWRGSMPGLALRPELDWSVFYSSYVRTYVERDLRDLTRIGDENTFLKFLRAAAARTAQVLNISDLARDCGVSSNTAAAWLSILVNSGLVMLLQPWSKNLGTRATKAPKLHFLDTGLCAWLTGWHSPEVLEYGAMAGAILETWVVAEILKTHLHNGRQVQLFYLRDRYGHEIDLLICENGLLYPIEIKRSSSPSNRDLQTVEWLRSRNQPTGPGAVVCLCRESVPLSATDFALPVTCI